MASWVGSAFFCVVFLRDRLDFFLVFFFEPEALSPVAGTRSS
jgi:hypothetical protein